MAETRWQCNKCGTQRQAAFPPGTGSCPSGGNHVWSKLAFKDINPDELFFE